MENCKGEGDRLESFSREELIKLVNEQKRSIKLQEDFLLNISHDLRTPINVILSVLQCINHDGEDENKQSDKLIEYRKLIKRNSLKIVKLVDNLIDSSKLQRNYFKLDKHNVEVVNMIENTVSSMRKYSQEKNINIIFDTNEEECISGVDPQALDRIVMNLLSNALKFSPSNSEIMVVMDVQEKYFTISVKDKGPGISKEDQKTIFNRFIQATNGKKSEYEGSGIGLDLVNYLSKAHGGKVELFSEEGKGCNFVVTLPIEKVASEQINFQLETRSKVDQLEIEFSDIYL